MKVTPLSDACGAEITGVDLSCPLDDATFDAIHRALLGHCVIAIRDQDLTPEQHIAFSERFGPVTGHVLDQFLLPGYPQVLRISNKTGADGNPLGLRDAGRYWHSDVSYAEKPSMGSLLYALEIPPAGKGGDTLFANMYKAYDTLSDEMKARIDGLTAVFMIGRRRNRDDRVMLSDEQEERSPDVIHPVVRTHPETGRKALFVNPAHTDRIVGMDPAESRALLDELNAHSTRPEFVYRHKWRLHDLVFWDNRCLMHIADPPEPGHDRHMHRTTVEGDRPV